MGSRSEDTTKRVATFELLKKLYRERSNLVHGNKAIDAKWVGGNWDGIVKASKLCIVRKITFLQENNASDWQDYLDRLALGA